jgi:hypothetical protein
MEPSRRRSLTVLVAALAAVALMPTAAQAASLHVVFPQTAEVTVVQGASTNFSIEVQAFGATRCAATTAPVRIETLYSVDAVGDIASGLAADMPIETDDPRGTSENCDIKTPVVVPLTATAAAETPVGDYTGVIRYGKGGDGGIDLDGPVLTIHVIAPDAQPEVLPEPELAAPEIIVLGERSTPKPKLGKSVMLTLVKGTVTYVSPGKPGATLTGSAVVPNGTKVDATGGVVKVTVVRDGTGALDSADAWAGAFVAVQGIEKNGRGLTTFTLRQGFGSSNKGASAARVARVVRKRKLWVNGKGNFKTRGKRASAIVRGTYWYTEETQKATKVSVKRGLVAVRDFVNRKTVLVSRGQSYTAQLRHAVVHRVPAFTGSVRH